MCKLTSQEKKIVGLSAAVSLVCLAYPAYNIYNGVSAFTLANKVADCVCASFGNITSTCQSSISALVGPGLEVANWTTFCKVSTSAVNVATATATTKIASYSLLGAVFVVGGAVMAWKIIKKHREQNAMPFQAY
jgi:hypothetical protein